MNAVLYSSRSFSSVAANHGLRRPPPSGVMYLKNSSTSVLRRAALIWSMVDFTCAATVDGGPGASSGAPVSNSELGRHVDVPSDTRCVARLTSESLQYAGVSAGGEPDGANQSSTMLKVTVLVRDGRNPNESSPSYANTSGTKTVCVRDRNLPKNTTSPSNSY